MQTFGYHYPSKEWERSNWGVNVNEKDSVVMTALMWASMNGNTDTVSKLIELIFDLNLNEKNNGDWTAFHIPRAS